MKKPQTKQEVNITYAHKDTLSIYLFASSDAIADFSDFGKITNEYGNKYSIDVDGRYDFDEVVAYIKQYGQ